MKLLPISEVLPELINTLMNSDTAILEAPPGAGKTTAVPLALLDQPWLGSQKILLLEPRRIAAKSAALRLSANLNQAVGQRVGYRVRLESKVSANTQIEVITQGILTRMLQQDPSLEGIGLIIFDEFHQRSLDNDLNLALCLESRALFREQQPLKLLLMSATLNGLETSKILDNAPIITSKGKRFAVDIFYTKVQPKSQYPSSLEQSVVKLIRRALDEQTGSLLVFLPGQKEIHKVSEILTELLAPDSNKLEIALLYGSLTFQKQQRAIKPAPPQWRKIVLATNIAETSITIEGISGVIDSGLCRRATFDATTGVTRLTTQKISQAASVQRAGRAGRTAAGACYRLWSRDQQQSLAPFEVPEIASADLSHLLLNLLLWGSDNFSELSWLTPPRVSQIEQASQLLINLKAVDSFQGELKLNAHGEKICLMPMPPRLAHMCIVAASMDIGDIGCDLAAILSEGDPLKQRQVDLLLRLIPLQSTQGISSANNANQWQRVRQQSRLFRQQLAMHSFPDKYISLNDLPKTQQVAVLIAHAWPERIAQRLSDTENSFKLANGRRAQIANSDHLATSKYLAIAHCANRTGQNSEQIYLACELDPKLFQETLSTFISLQQKLQWHEKNQRFLAEEQSVIGEIVISKRSIKVLDIKQKRLLILDIIRKRGLSLLDWSKKLQQYKARVVFLTHQSQTADPWPNLEDDHLLSSLDLWLAPYLTDSFVRQFNQLDQLKALDIASLIKNLLPWPMPEVLEKQAPTSFLVPSGSHVTIDYSQSPPILAVKLQEMFGCITTPTIAHEVTQHGVALQLHLLSPAGKALQITQDIGNFWHTSYIEVKKEMKGRYPRHPWPDDPMRFAPTKKTNRKLAQQKNHP